MNREALIPPDQRSTALSVNQTTFLAAFAQLGNIWQAALAAGIHRKQHYRWLKDDPAYQEAFAHAREEAADTLEAEAVRRARDGYEEPVYGKLPGRDSGAGQIGTIKKYSDFLLMGLLKAHRPEKFSEQVNHQHTGTVEAKISFYLPSNGRDTALGLDAAIVDAETLPPQTPPASESERPNHTRERVGTSHANEYSTDSENGGVA